MNVFHIEKCITRPSINIHIELQKDFDCNYTKKKKKKKKEKMALLLSKFFTHSFLFVLFGERPRAESDIHPLLLVYMTKNLSLPLHAIPNASTLPQSKTKLSANPSHHSSHKVSQNHLLAHHNFMKNYKSPAGKSKLPQT